MAKADTHPVPRFVRFEQVVVLEDGSRLPSLVGQHGTVIWRDPPQGRDSLGQWVYVIYFAGLNSCLSFLESTLQSMGKFDQETEHLGRSAEISFDLVMSDDMGFVEGSYRLPGRFWEVFGFHKDESPQLSRKICKWDGGITGVDFTVPLTRKLNREFVLTAMTEAFGIESWAEVRGPDSIILR